MRFLGADSSSPNRTSRRRSYQFGPAEEEVEYWVGASKALGAKEEESGEGGWMGRDEGSCCGCGGEARDGVERLVFAVAGGIMRPGMFAVGGGGRPVRWEGVPCGVALRLGWPCP
jgi:hypothetical protein